MPSILSRTPKKWSFIDNALQSWLTLVVGVGGTQWKINGCKRLRGRGERQVASVEMKMEKSSSIRKGGNLISHFSELRGYVDSASHYSAGFWPLKRHFKIKQLFKPSLRSTDYFEGWLNYVGWMLSHIHWRGQRGKDNRALLVAAVGHVGHLPCN